MRRAPSLSSRTPTGTDVLRWPVVGPFLRWRHARSSVQLTLLAAAIVLVVHGLTGPDLAPANLSTVLTWVHYRGLLVIALVAAGNVFCAGCPFILVRDWGRRLHIPSRVWPARLRTKWIAIALFVAVLFSYELFDLWAQPRTTAVLVLGYFAAAFAVDLIFKGATFCKHLCPVGQFNFVASTMSPLELRIKDAGTCQACRTEDCIAGRRAPASPAVVVQRGCELGLFLPAKVGNLECTFCLDCVQACPHDNIALGDRAPGVELADGRLRSVIGRLQARVDFAALSIVFTFAAMLNAFAMVAPVYRLEAWLARSLGTTSEFVVLGCVFVCALGVLPGVLIGAAAAVARALAPAGAESIVSVAVRYAYGLVPFGFGMWLAHYSFHFLTGALTVVPVTQSAAIDLLGWPMLGAPFWGWAGMRPGAVLPIQLGFVVLGTMGSLALTHLISLRDRADRAARATMPWAVLLLLLAAVAIWILFQPMEMRGVELGA
jgi:polyferredoxin